MVQVSTALFEVFFSRPWAQTTPLAFAPHLRVPTTSLLGPISEHCKPPKEIRYEPLHSSSWMTASSRKCFRCCSNSVHLACLTAQHVYRSQSQGWRSKLVADDELQAAFIHTENCNLQRHLACFLTNPLQQSLRTHCTSIQTLSIYNQHCVQETRMDVGDKHLLTDV